MKFLLSWIAAIALLLSPLFAQALTKEAFDLRFEAKGSYRNSEDETFAVPFPPGESLATVDEGESFELSTITTFLRVQLAENWLLLSKLDLIDLYDRNPTSSDNKVDLDQLLLRYGTRHTQGELPESFNWYAQIGKFGKFERQEDRHLDSYGLVSTSFNRLEDSGIELGVDLPMGFYTKLAYTTGNPFFFRDPNALAGDNGVGIIGEKPEHDTGVLVFYDAEVEGFDLNENPETSLGLGFRWLSDSGASRVNVLLHYNERDLADTIELEGTGYGGDLDLLSVELNELPPGAITSPVGFVVSEDNKEEAGVTFWYYQDSFALFAQYVKQDVAGLQRDAWEVELSYAFVDVPGFFRITPALRYSRLEPDFSGVVFPAPSVFWEWDKLDYGVNFDVNRHVRITIEHADNQFLIANREQSNDETLVTLRLSYDVF